MGQVLLPIFPAEATPINGLLSFEKRGDTVYYFTGIAPIFSHKVEDYKSFRLITAQFVVNGTAKQMDIVRAFEISPISMKRYVKLYREKGINGIFKPPAARPARVLTPEVLEKIQDLLSSGEEIKEIAKQLSLKVNTLQKALKDGRLKLIKKKLQKYWIPYQARARE